MTIARSSPATCGQGEPGVTTVITAIAGSVSPAGSRRAPPPPLDLIAISPITPIRASPIISPRSTNPAGGQRRLLVGHSSLRLARCANSTGRPGRRDHADATAPHEALEAGAIGLSSGLYYARPRMPAAEIEALAALLRPAGALYTTHMRTRPSMCSTASTRAFRSAAPRRCRW